MSDRPTPFQPNTRVIRRRRRKFLACDSCSKRKIQCDRATPRCDWCRHHDFPCVYTRNQTRLNQQEQRTASVGSSPGSCPHFDTRRSPAESASEVNNNPANTTNAKLHSPGLALRNICVFNGLPFFSSGGREWIKALVGEEVDLNQYNPPKQVSWLRPQARATTIPLPDEAFLRQGLEAYKSCVFFHIFPFINPLLFEETMRVTYQEENTPDCSNADAKACVFAFVAAAPEFGKFLPNEVVVKTDDYARAAYDLVPTLLMDSGTLDGLQAVLLLVLHSQSALGDMLSVELLISTATRFVFHLGGHIDTERSGDVDSRPLTLRLHLRNLFWICYMFNQEYSMRTGVPPNFDNALCDLTMPKTSKEGADEATSKVCSPLFIPFIELAKIESQIYRRLYSVPAQNQTDTELLQTIRDLDEVLEDWKLSLPMHNRPSLTHRPKNVEDPPSSILQLKYHYCMAMIHQASGRCISWTQNTRGLGSSLAISMEASRSLLRIFACSEHALHRWNLLFCLPYFTAAMVHLFCDILLHPLDESCHDHLKLLDMVRDRMVTVLWPQAPPSFQMQVQLVKDLSLEIQRLARKAMQRAAE
ncbi:hypothetical protein BJX96DRAFT_94051 [Aspergillus floccosus]